MCRKRRSTFISLTAVECVHWTHGIKIERNNLLCEQAPTEVFRSIFAWLVTLNLAVHAKLAQFFFRLLFGQEVDTMDSLFFGGFDVLQGIIQEYALFCL